MKEFLEPIIWAWHNDRISLILGFGPITFIILTTIFGVLL